LTQFIISGGRDGLNLKDSYFNKTSKRGKKEREAKGATLDQKWVFAVGLERHEDV